MQAKLLCANLPLAFILSVSVLSAQQSQPPERALLEAILKRMDALEQQNREMAQELHQVREELATARQAQVDSPPAAPLEDRVGVAENRIEEQAQTKVEASQKFPITMTGQLLFNTFANTGRLRALPDTTYAPFIEGDNTTGATFRQTMLGFDYRGPSLPGNGKINANIMLDFYSGIPSEQLDWLRIRTGDISLDWRNRSLTVALDKPLISPRQPNSLAEVSIPPLADAGNLWLWLPQIRYEERFGLGSSAGIIAQGALVQTNETYNYVSSYFNSSLEKSRPAGEGRVGIWKAWNDGQRLEVATGFHASTSHVAESSAASRIFSVDWLATPFSKLEISGTFFHGQNFGPLGALSPGIVIAKNNVVAPVHGNGGWTQFSTPLTSRLTLNLFAGFQQNRLNDIESGETAGNMSYAGNLMFHLSSNVILSFESLQMRSRVKQDGDLIRNRYDLALAYLF